MGKVHNVIVPTNVNPYPERFEVEAASIIAKYMGADATFLARDTAKTPDIVKSLMIPVPSLKKQKEIVKKLDVFSEITSDLEKGLPKEIELRTKQYEYYRDKLLTFKELA